MSEKELIKETKFGSYYKVSEPFLVENVRKPFGNYKYHTILLSFSEKQLSFFSEYFDHVLDDFKEEPYSNQIYAKFGEDLSDISKGVLDDPNIKYCDLQLIIIGYESKKNNTCNKKLYVLSANESVIVFR